MNPGFIETLAGGLLIGLASATILFFNGRIAGISGIASGFIFPSQGEMGWRGAFLAGLLGAGLVGGWIAPERFAGDAGRTLPMLAVAGVLVGFGTRLGNGCTSGHGVCGLSRFSARSMVATATFMAAATLTVFLVKLLGGAA